MGTLSLEPLRAEIPYEDAEADGIGLKMAYSGDGFDPLRCELYVSLDEAGWVPAQTIKKQYDTLWVEWPGSLTGTVDGTRASDVQFLLSYTQGRSSVSARASVKVLELGHQP